MERAPSPSLVCFGLGVNNNCAQINRDALVRRLWPRCLPCGLGASLVPNLPLCLCCLQGGRFFLEHAARGTILHHWVRVAPQPRHRRRCWCGSMSSRQGDSTIESGWSRRSSTCMRPGTASTYHFSKVVSVAATKRACLASTARSVHCCLAPTAGNFPVS
jgi:hypothetical protein